MATIGSTIETTSQENPDQANASEAINSDPADIAAANDPGYARNIM